MKVEIFAYLLVFAPLFAAAIIGLLSSRVSDLVANVVTCAGVLLSALSATVLFKTVALGGENVHVTVANWLSSGTFVANWAIMVDPLTSIMLVVVTYVSSLVHIYSVGYMSHDDHKPRFMAYLSLFTFFMLCLVTSDNFIQMFFGWEGVGLASYLLIGFWFQRPSANAAAMKAFLVNRVGDFGFALGIFMTFWYFGSVEFAKVFPVVPSLVDARIMILGEEVNVVTLTCLLLFIGAMGKSAQLGLHTWLPDAMEGPTPVSALIHAATMVTAGVFMVARCSPMFEYSDTALLVVTCVGAFTCIFAATVALTQNDIKRVIAYSTCSQLGYMFFACGVSAYAAGIFHLMTHAFFKALLFLGAGSVIHAMSDEQDMRKMGGIWKMIPYTYAMMWIGSLALAGIFPFAGFYSKDLILESAMASRSEFGASAYYIGLAAAVLTAFYSWRLIMMTFHGKSRASKQVLSHVHESPISMTAPLALLAIGSIVTGYLGYHLFGFAHHAEHNHDFWRGAIHVLMSNNSIANVHNIDHIYGYYPLFAGIFGIVAGMLVYGKVPVLAEAVAARFKPLYQFLLNKWYFDELYDYMFVKPLKKLGKYFWKKTDMVLIDGMPNGAASLTSTFSRVVSVFQTGFVYHYTMVMIAGLIALLTWTVFLIL